LNPKVWERFGDSATDGTDIHGYFGKGATIICSYSWASTNIKYFCRDPCGDSKDILVKSDQSPTGRYTLKDSGEGTFTVKITDLQESDSGIYWFTLTVSKGKNDSFSSYPNESITTSTQPYKETQTCLDLHTTTPVAHSESPSTTPSLTSRESNHFFTTIVSLSLPQCLHTQYAVGGLVIAAILFLVGLVTVHQSRNRVKTSESMCT
uniref:Immunoglobulin V-set domain-containing protein n=1 Tax=Cyprinus carpio TaxID=7962 RepID=A0A8C1YUA3_CYPCA